MANTTKKVTLADLRRMALLETDQAAREMTGFTEMELAEYKYDTGLAYLRAAVKCPSAFAYLEGSKEYWNWWRNQWELRDAAGIPELVSESIAYFRKGGSVPRIALREGYDLIHAAGVLLDPRNEEYDPLLRSFNVLVGRLVEQTARPPKAA